MLIIVRQLGVYFSPAVAGSRCFSLVSQAAVADTTYGEVPSPSAVGKWFIP